MKKKTMSYMMTGALSITILSGVSSSPAEAASPQFIREQATASISRTKTKNFADVVAEQAAALGVSINGDSLETAARKVRLAKLNKQAAALGIETADQDEKTLRLYVKKAHEINVYNLADYYGVETEGRRLKDIIADIAAISPESAAQLTGFY